MSTRANSDELRCFKNSINPKKENGSFFVYRLRGYVFCVYYSGHINVTGIKFIQEIQYIENIINEFYGIKKVIKSTIDNITCTAKISASLYTWNEPFASYLRKIDDISIFDIIQYSPQTFPGAFLKTTNSGTIIFFATGKINIVGCKSVKTIKQLLKKFFKGIIEIKKNEQLRVL